MCIATDVDLIDIDRQFADIADSPNIDRQILVGQGDLL